MSAGRMDVSNDCSRLLKQPCCRCRCHCSPGTSSSSMHAPNIRRCQQSHLLDCNSRCCQRWDQRTNTWLNRRLSRQLVARLLILLLTVMTDLSRSLSAYILGTERRNLWLFPLPPWSIMLLLCCGWSWHILRVESCATRPSPRTRPLRPTWSPDIHVEYENCTEDYAALFCLNDGICFRTKIVDTFIISCECKPGWYGRRCEYQDIGDRYLPVQQRVEVASIAGSLTVLIVVIVFVSVVLYIYYRRRRTAVELMDDPNLSLTDPFGHQVGSLSRENSFLYNEKTPTMVISLKPVPDGVAQESSTKQTLV